MSKRAITSFSLFFFFIVLFLGISLSINNTHNKDEVKIKNDLQTKINEFSDELNSTLKQLSNTLQKDGLQTFEEQALQNRNEQNKPLAFYLYEDHELLFWTNNHLLIPSNDSLFKPTLSCSQIGPHWLLTQSISVQNYTLVGTRILKVNYTLKNDLLKDDYLKSYGIEGDLTLSKNRGEFEITDKQGNFLFSFHIHKNTLAKNEMPYLLFFTFLLAYLFFVFCLDIAIKNSKIIQSSETTKTIAFSTLSALFLLFFSAINFPSSLYQSPLFQAQTYSNLSTYSSLGQLFLISIWLFSSTLYASKHLKLSPTKKQSVFNQIGITTLILLILTMLYYGLYALLHSLVFDSQITLEITSITNLNFYSYSILALVMFLQLSWFIISKKLIEFALTTLKNKLFYILISFFIALLFGYLPLQEEPIGQFNQLFLFLYFLSIFYLFPKREKVEFWQNVYYLILFISISGIYYISLSNQKEEAIRKSGFSTYLLKNDPLLENNFLNEKERMLSDSLVLSYLNDGNYSQDELIDFINRSYFKDDANNYEISMVFCDAESKLLLLPEELETPCFPFFEERIKEASDTILENTLYLVDQHFRTKNYIGIIEFDKKNGEKTRLFVEFLSKYQPKELGMPALLSNAKNWDLRFFSNYAYAYYYNGKLSEWFGKFDYKQTLEAYGENTILNENSFSFEGYMHYIYVQDSQNVILVSKPKISWLEQFASLAFLFLFYSLNISGLFLLIYLSQNYNSLNIGFQTRLQISMIAILLFSFFTIGLASLYYLNYLNDEKNKGVLMEKVHSVLIELEHKLQDIDDDSEEQKEYLESLLIKFSQVFFTDINLYDLDGRLLATSRPQLFDSELLSERMNPDAFYSLGLMKSSLFMQNEHIGLQEFYSVYIPFRSIDNQTVAYLNLPYFAKQHELEEEISGFLVAYLNIYMFLILLTLTLTILISNYLSKPLKFLREKIRHLKLESANEKIEWNKNDEIGALVLEYNRMVEELAESAEKLARSQRESAWREMAQQIAHEIKNPLTPMKLNIQYLEKAWLEGGEDFDNKLHKIAKNLTEQIDSLSDIASQFSSFAASNQIKVEPISVKPLITSAIDLFSRHKNIRFENQLPDEEVVIKADRNQFIRILNNLIKNAIQSITDKNKGEIKIKLTLQDQTVEIQIKDNGCGISEKERIHVFEPRFTTKTGGMGLGLALVKKMVENADGTIRFESQENLGTRFILQFPKYTTV